MKKLLIILSLALVILCTLSLPVMATAENTEQSAEPSIDNMKEMEIAIDSESVEAFVNSLGLMGKGMFGIFVVTLVIIGAVAVLNWHGRSLERRNQNKKD